MQSRIVGTTMPVLEITMAPGERLTAEGGDVAWLTSGFSLETSTRFGSGGRGGLMSGLKRALGGGGLFLTEYSPPPSGGFVAFAAQLPNSAVRLPNGNTLIASQNTRRVIEFDRNGREVWSHNCEGAVFNARRR